MRGSGPVSARAVLVGAAVALAVGLTVVFAPLLLLEVALYFFFRHQDRIDAADAWNLDTNIEYAMDALRLPPWDQKIGVLSGGSALCGNNLPDFFGRLNVAWEGGGTAATRVKDWLDPASTGATTLDGRASCTQPVPTLTQRSGRRSAGA